MPINSFSNYQLNWIPDKQKLTRPIYQSLIEQLKQDIATGKLVPDTQLPPQRELADYLDIGFATVTRAYQLSQKLGLTYGVVGKGTFVAANAHNHRTIMKDSNHHLLDLGFISSFECCNRRLQKTLHHVLNRQDAVQLLDYNYPLGLPSHRQLACSYLKQLGLLASSKNVIITSGGQNAITLALMSLFKPGDYIAVDQFTFANFVEIAKMKEIKLLPIPSDEEGMDAKLLAVACQKRKIKGIYLMPDCNNPSTIQISRSRRHQIAKLIQKYNLILLEDDYLSFVNLYRTKPLPRISTLVPDHSIYIASMSKPVASGLRVAFTQVGSPFLSAMQEAIYNINVKTSSLDAEIAVQAFQDGTSKIIMEEKLQRARQANQLFNQIFPWAPRTEAEQFFRMIPLTTHVDGSKLEKALLQNQIRTFHSDKFVVGEAPQQQFLRISLSGITKLSQLKLALLKLRTYLREQQLILE